MGIIIAIDGPSGSGKGTVAKGLANLLGFVHLDSGAIYRSVTLETLRNNISIEDEAGIVNLIDDMQLEFYEDETIFLNGENITKRIRENDVTNNVSNVSKIKEVRIKVDALQKKVANNKNVIVEGRDTGSTVFPNANVKFYLDADIEERAKRRYKENLEKGIKTTYEEVLEILKNRDYIDSHREFSPLRKPDDAIVIDSTNLTIEEVINKMENIIREKCSL